ncbi:MAG: NADP-dependent oxidoreductase [Bacteroidetes bacterium]|nr:NADP-dependent oxidoreductase [Bacteroidota bacterium]
MKAVRIHQFGGPDVLELEEAPMPEPAADEVLVKVYATSVNPVDWKIREGARKEKFPVGLPLIPGWDVSGVVEKVGENVKRFKWGDEVYGRPDPSKNGAYAEYIVVKASQLGLKPKSIDHINAAAVPLAGLTAWQGLFDRGHLQKGQKVLIHAASGGVGSFAVQFAKWKGAYVIGTTSAANISFVKQLGADEVIDYKSENFEDRLSDIDLVFDTIGGETQKRSIQVLKNGGRLITTLKPEFQAEAKEKHIYLEGYTAQSYPEQLEQIGGLIDEGRIQPVISMVMSLEEARKAQRISEEGHVRGKIVIKVV